MGGGYEDRGYGRSASALPEPVLLPRPANVTWGAGRVAMPLSASIAECFPDDAVEPGLRSVPASQLLDDLRETAGLRWDIARSPRLDAFITLAIDGAGADLPADGYALAINANVNAETDVAANAAFSAGDTRPGVTITAGGFEGLRYGVQTLRQLIRQCAPVLPEVRIEDRPAYPIRTYYLDVARGRVPTLDWLKSFADKLALYKYNQFQLYVEHSFDFNGLSEMWRGASPLTGADLIALDGHCARLGIDFVPSLSTFGHLYKALRTRKLRALGEFPDQAGRPHSLIERLQHHTINAAEPESRRAVKAMIDEYAPLFRSRSVNLCADETFDLGRGATAALAARVGKGILYADYVADLCARVTASGRAPMIWADVAIENPAILDRLPKDVTLLNWLYEPDVPEDKVSLVARSGARQIVCAGLWTWDQLVPRFRDAWRNVTRLARCGLKYGAAGFMVTDWGDFGHINDSRLSVPGMIAAADAAWTGGGACENCDDCDDDAAFDAMNAAISRLEYGDPTGRLVGDYVAAGECGTLDWGAMVRYAELVLGGDVSAGDGGESGDAGSDAVRAPLNDRAPLSNCAPLNSEVARFVDSRMGGNPVIRERPLSQCADGLEARDRFVRALVADDRFAARFADYPAARSRFDRARLAVGTDLARAGRVDARTRGAIWTSLEGQRVVDDAFAALAGVSGASDRDVAAESLEVWFERYADVWREVSREAELRHVSGVVWAVADALRS